MEERPKVLGLNLELATVVTALEAMRLLLTGELETAGNTKRAVEAILALTRERVELLRAIIRGELDPAVAVAEYNATMPEEMAADTDDGEVRLHAWTESESIERLTAQLARARRIRGSSRPVAR